MQDLDPPIDPPIDPPGATVIESRRLPGYLGMVGLDDGGVIRYISADLDGRFGIALHDAIGRSFVDFIDDADLPQAMLSFGGVTERSGHHQALQLGLRDSSGVLRQCELVAENCLDVAGIELVLFNLSDADDRRRSVHLLDAQADVVRQLTLGSTAVETIGPALAFLERALPGFAAAAYLSDDLVIGRATVPGSLPHDWADRMAAAIATDPTMPGALAVDGNEGIVAADLTDPRWSGAARVAGDGCGAIWSMPIRHEYGGPSYGIFEVYSRLPCHPSDSDWVSLRLVSRLAAAGVDRLRLQQRLRDAADIDPLTATPNRRVITALLDDLVADAGAGRAVCFIDLDRLKVVNDGLGHEAGDQLIAAAARRLTEQMAGEATLGRFGGDEFVAIAHRSELSATVLAQRCVDAFGEPLVVAGRPWRITASVGVVVVDQHRSAGEILRDADAAMYEAKHGGRNRFHVFDSLTRDAVVRRMDLEQQLADAIEHDQLVPHFQPLVHCSDWSLAGYEGLARWPGSGDPWVAPAEFVPVLEELGLIDLLGRRMIGHALGLLDRLDESGRPDVAVGVNVSPLQLISTELFDDLDEAAARGRRTNRLYLEMTEQHMVDDSEQTLTSLDRLLQSGVRLAVDDFGTGYSSLGALHQLPASTLKLDRHLVSHVDTPKGRSVVTAVVGVADAFGMWTVAEGVETPAQALALRDLGVDALQGFLFASPEPIDAALARSGPGWRWDVAPAELDAPAPGARSTVDSLISG